VPADAVHGFLAAGLDIPPPASQVSVLQALYVTPTGSVDTAVLVPTHPRLAVLGLIGYASSTSLTRVDLLTVVELTSRLSMWTSTETVHRPNLRATRVACALGYCRDIVSGTADPAGNPTSLSAAQTAHVRDLT
jgi:hypothetical protein